MTRPGINETHDPMRTSWIESANGHRDFPIQNLPFGMFSPGTNEPRIGVAIGDMILDLGAVAAVDAKGMNAIASLEPADRVSLRRHISTLLSDPTHRPAVAQHLHRAEETTLHLPFVVGDYTDFYAGIHHARNVGALFRPDQPLMPNYKHVPIGYHGRASSIRPSGVPVVRPHGQSKGLDADGPIFGPSRRLDYELELGIWIGKGNPQGAPIPIAEAADHIAGFCLLNDWSARDFQAWEYQPLGPFLAKSFHSTVSPWVITPEALAPFRLAQPPRPEGDPVPLAYLLDADDQRDGAYAIKLKVALQTAMMKAAGHAPQIVGRSAAHHLYWTISQLIAHHSSNGCNLRAGDLLGTGTISGPGRDHCGSLLEATLGGSTPLFLPTGETRTFLEDGDMVVLSATAQADGCVPIGFGPCRAEIRPAS